MSNATVIAVVLKPMTPTICSSYLHRFQFCLPTSTDSNSVFLPPGLSSFLVPVLDSERGPLPFPALNSPLKNPPLKFWPELSSFRVPVPVLDSERGPLIPSPRAQSPFLSSFPVPLGLIQQCAYSVGTLSVHCFQCIF
jgi:hypothetical protein